MTPDSDALFELFASSEDDYEPSSYLTDDGSEDDVEKEILSSEPSSKASGHSFKRNFPEWVKMPIKWINDGKLKSLKWTKEEGSKNESALIVLMVMFHCMDNETGIVSLTYEELLTKTNLSRSMVASAIDILCKLGLIQKNFEKRSVYKIIEFNPKEKWAKLPAKKMYFNEGVKGFSDFTKRNKIELDAIKLYFLFIFGRDRNENICWISYDKIQEKIDLKRENIKKAISILCINHLIVVDQKRTEKNLIKQGYRIVGISDYTHSGTLGRGLI